MITNRSPRATPVAVTTGPESTPSIPSPPTPTEQEQIVGVSQLMLTSLPPMMSGADVYMRQFYRGSRLPSRRFLPLPAQRQNGL